MPVRREIDKCYCYTLKPSPIHHKSNKVEHFLKIIDTFIELEQPDQCLIEPILGSYKPDLFFKDHFNRSICVEVQITKISIKKMQAKLNSFIKEYGKNHDAKLLMLYSNYDYHELSLPTGFKIIQKPLAKSPSF